MKLRKIENCCKEILTIFYKKQYFSTSRSEIVEKNISLFLFHHLFPLEGVFRYSIFLMQWEINSKQRNVPVLLERRSKVQRKTM